MKCMGHILLLLTMKAHHNTINDAFFTFLNFPANSPTGGFVVLRSVTMMDLLWRTHFYRLLGSQSLYDQSHVF